MPLKIFTANLRNSIFDFLIENNFVEHDIQKGFTPKVSGTVEHTSQMTAIINNARMKQKSVVITLLDLKNAFGEVHHNLIPCILKYHNIPDDITKLVCHLYQDFRTPIITSKYSIAFLPVKRGVLQGDSFSPLMFNMCFHTFI